jgi:hypothetical protein
VLRAGQQHVRADRQVDQEHHPPAEAEEVGVDQQAGDDRAEHGREPRDRPEDPPRLAHLLGLEQDADHPEHLRDHHGAEPALERPGGDQRLDRGRDGRGERGDGEAGGAGQQDALAAEHVAQAPAGEQADRHRERVGRGDPLQARVGPAQVVADRRPGDARDRRVQQVHHGRGQCRGECDPAGPR